MIEQTFNNSIIKVGENAIENQMLLETSNLTDLWVHISNYPSAHAVITHNNETCRKKTRKLIKRACCIVKSKSKTCKSMKKVLFDICKIQDLTLTDVPGKVIINGNCKNITI